MSSLCCTLDRSKALQAAMGSEAAASATWKEEVLDAVLGRSVTTSCSRAQPNICYLLSRFAVKSI